MSRFSRPVAPVQGHDRRALLRMGLGLATVALAGCTQERIEVALPSPSGIPPAQLAGWRAMYREMPEERFPIPEIDLSEVDADVLRAIVPDPTGEMPGTIVIETRNHALYLVLEGGQALRYGVGVGKEGLAWRGRAQVGRKAEWPRWTPTADMIAREPERNARWAGGMQPGLDNPLGARALYLYRNNADTLYRIHGTNEPWSIGESVSSGCIRMINQDVIDLYNRVPVGANVLVKL
jgi:lipoprotein-anchoring transpeptidase ErfK/SrfK